MIITNVKNPESLAMRHPLLDLALKEMDRLLEENAPEGRYEIQGDELFINIMSYETNAHSNCVYENHKNYIDVQMMMEGEEDIGFAEEQDLTVKAPYVPDVAIFHMHEPKETARISRGIACVIFPPEPHAPGMAVDNIPQKVKKMVAKIKT